jgi:hypothetical protein
MEINQTIISPKAKATTRSTINIRFSFYLSDLLFNRYR